MTIITKACCTESYSCKVLQAFVLSRVPGPLHAICMRHLQSSTIGNAAYPATTAVAAEALFMHPAPKAGSQHQPVLIRNQAKPSMA